MCVLVFAAACTINYGRVALYRGDNQTLENSIEEAERERERELPLTRARLRRDDCDVLCVVCCVCFHFSFSRLCRFRPSFARSLSLPLALSTQIATFSSGACVVRMIVCVYRKYVTSGRQDERADDGRTGKERETTLRDHPMR